MCKEEKKKKNKPTLKESIRTWKVKEEDNKNALFNFLNLEVDTQQIEKACKKKTVVLELAD